jgi:3-phenylpropionate/trans-cinnamate dioxygenase ferredoxin component
MTASWIEACAADDIELKDVLRFDHDGRTFAIYRSPDDRFYATDGLCTHEHAHLADGLVLDNLIECPKHTAASTTGPARRSGPRHASISGPTRSRWKMARF